MGLFGSMFGSGKPESKADKKARIKQQYDGQIASCQMNIDNYKKAIENARWQYKMNKHPSHKRTIEDNQQRLKQAREQMKRIKENKAAALKNV